LTRIEWQASAWSFAASTANRLIAAIVTKIEIGSGTSRANLHRRRNQRATRARLRHHGTKIEAYNVLHGLQNAPRAFPRQFPATVFGREFGGRKLPCRNRLTLTANYLIRKALSGMNRVGSGAWMRFFPGVFPTGRETADYLNRLPALSAGR
jgi:hypothetical protein